MRGRPPYPAYESRLVSVVLVNPSALRHPRTLGVRDTTAQDQMGIRDEAVPWVAPSSAAVAIWSSAPMRPSGQFSVRRFALHDP